MVKDVTRSPRFTTLVAGLPTRSEILNRVNVLNSHSDLHIRVTAEVSN
jgi:hypothetical protein